MLHVIFLVFLFFATFALVEKAIKHSFLATLLFIFGVLIMVVFTLIVPILMADSKITSTPIERYDSVVGFYHNGNYYYSFGDNSQQKTYSIEVQGSGDDCKIIVKDDFGEINWFYYTIGIKSESKIICKDEQ